MAILGSKFRNEIITAIFSLYVNFLCFRHTRTYFSLIGQLNNTSLPKKYEKRFTTINKTNLSVIGFWTTICEKGLSHFSNCEHFKEFLCEILNEEAYKLCITLKAKISCIIIQILHERLSHIPQSTRKINSESICIEERMTAIGSLHHVEHSITCAAEWNPKVEYK